MRPFQNVASVLLLLILTTSALANRPYCGKILTVTSQVESGGQVAYCGSFVIVAPNMVLTNHHNIRDLGDGHIILTFADGSQKAGEVVDSTEDDDLALVKFATPLNKGLHRIPVGAEDPTGPITIGGYPGCGDYVEKVSNSCKPINPNCFVFEGIYKTGFSGSPIINHKGYLVGLLWGSDFGPDNPDNVYYGYATRIEQIRHFLQKNDVLFD